MDNMPVRGGGSATSGAAPTRRAEARPAHGAVQQQTIDEPNRYATHAGHGGQKKSKKKMVLWGTIAAAVLLIIVVGSIFYLSSNRAMGIDNSKYQAVFFTNGQVYFGKLQEQNQQYLKLTDIYYLQTQDNADSKNPQQTADQKASNVQLVKLGNEIHGPVDEMLISRDQVLFFENLKNEGKVAQTIGTYQGAKK